MNRGEVLRHDGVVVEAFDDLSISVRVPALADSVLPDVRPEVVSAVRWRPRPGDRVVILQRMAPLHPELAFTWLGLAWDAANRAVLPTWLLPGQVHIVSEDGTVQVALEDWTEHPPELPGTDPTAPSVGHDGPYLRLGSVEADEPAMLGRVWQRKMTSAVDAIADAADALRDLADRLAAAAWIVSTGGTASPTPVDILAFNGISAAAGTIHTQMAQLRTELHEATSRHVLVLP